MNKVPAVRGEERVVTAENELLGKALAVADKGYGLLYEKLDEMGPRDLVAASKAAGLLVAAKRRWNAEAGPGEGTGIGALAARLAELGGGKISIEVEREDDAIDVTPKAGSRGGAEG